MPGGGNGRSVIGPVEGFIFKYDGAPRSGGVKAITELQKVFPLRPTPAAISAGRAVGRKRACRRSMFSTMETVRAPGVPEFLPGRAENVFRGHCCREEKLRAMTSSSVYLCNLQRMTQAQKQTAEISYPAFVRCLLVCNFDIPPQSTSPPLCPSLVSSSAPTSLGAHSPVMCDSTSNTQTLPLHSAKVAFQRIRLLRAGSVSRPLLARFPILLPCRAHNQQ